MTLPDCAAAPAQLLRALAAAALLAVAAAAQAAPDTPATSATPTTPATPAKPAGAIAVVPRNTGTDGVFTGQLVLFHEYAHHFMLQYAPAAYPAWYVEGFAEVVSTASFERKGANACLGVTQRPRMHISLDAAPHNNITASI